MPETVRPVSECRRTSEDRFYVTDTSFSGLKCVPDDVFTAEKPFFCKKISKLEQTGNQLSDSLNVEQVMELARKVTGRYVVRGAIPEREADDVSAAMLEKFLLKKDQILQSFLGRASLNTYLTAVLNRMCCEVIRSENRHWYAVSEAETPAATEKGYHHADIDTLVNSEVAHLLVLLSVLGAEKYKIVLMARFYYHLGITSDDVNAWMPGHADELLPLFRRNPGTPKGELFAAMAAAVNHAERKNVKPDAVRMWLNKQMEWLLNGLNRDHLAGHTRETLVLLFERLPRGLF